MACEYLYQGQWYTENQLRNVYDGLNGPEGKPMVFLRHAITDEDTEGKNSGENDEPINQKGIEETNKEVEELRKQGVRAIYSSTTPRAMQTSKIFEEKLGIPVIQAEGLSAWDLGEFASKPEDDFNERYYVTNPDIKVPGGESFNEFKDRLLQAVDAISHLDQNPAILTHSKGLKVIEALEKTKGVWNNKAIDEYFGEKTPGNPQINHFKYHNTDKDSTIPARASKATLGKIKEFLDRIGAKVDAVSQTTMDGRVLGVNGIADPLNGLIMVVRGKEDTVLPEEAMHLAVELIEQSNPKLFNDMMNRVGRYKLFERVVSQYQNNPFYQTKEGKPDIRKIKKEAIGKVLAQTVIEKNQEATEKPELLDQTRNWWQKIIDFLKGLFSKAQFNPFQEAATQVLSGANIGTVHDLTGDPFLQISSNTSLADNIKQKDANISKKPDGTFEINGNRIKNTVQKEVEKFYKQRIGTNAADAFFKHYKRETESKVQVDLKDIFSRRVDDDGFVRQTPLPQTNPSAVDPNDNTYYQTLDGHIEQRLSSYPPGTKFLAYQNIFDGTTAATPDLIVISPQGKVDILQFKAAEATRAAGDIAVYIQQGYNVEIEGIRRVLEKGYGIKRDSFNLTRAIPIKVEYRNIGPGFPSILEKMTVGNTNVALIQDDLLLPIPSKSESSGDKKFDQYIERLRGLAQKIGSERVDPAKKLERTQRVAALTAAIRKLQLKRNADGLISSARTIIKGQKEKYKALVDKIAKTDPSIASVGELNKIAEDILSDKDQIQVYSDMHQIFKKVFTDGTVESQDAIQDAREISEDAKDITDQYYDLAVNFRTQKFAAKFGILDEFDPEKKITWYRRMIRSLSQSPIKAGAQLWELVKRINNKHKLEFLERYEELKKIEERTKDWLKGKSINELYNRIFAFDSQGRWTGRVIHKFSKQFYTDLKEAQRRKDMAWVKDNIDVPKYMEWFVDEHAKMIENAKTARIVPDDAENARLVQQQLQDFVDTFHIDFKRGVAENNYKLKEYPLESKWKSDAYKELEKTGNEPLLDLYKYYEKRLDESWRSGMFQEYVGWDWFPNVRRNLIEKLTTAKTPVTANTFLGNLRINAEDQTFGKIDPISGKPIDEVHALFIRDLGKKVEETPGTYFMDYSEKSMDIFKVLALWDSEIVKFNLKTESEAIARLLYFTEAQRVAYDTTSMGKLARREGTNEPIEISNEVNAQYIKEHIDAVYYGKKHSNEFDVTLTVGDQKLSGIKLIETMNRYYVTKTLGVNVMTSFAQIFGGTMNILINQGLYFNKADVGAAEYKYVSNKFWASEEDKKIAGLLGYLHPFLEDRSSQQIRSLSVSAWVRHLSSDHLFFMQRGSDNWVNSIVAIAMIQNTMVVDGKLVNMREQARKELNHDGKYQGTYEQSKEFDIALEKKVEEYKKSPQALVNYAQIVNDQIDLPGIQRTGDTVIDLRQQILEIIKDALGNTSHDDLSLYKRSIMWQSFFMFKNWIPRMFDVRFQSLKYSPGTQKYEYGRVRMLWNAVRGLGARNTASLLLKLGNDPKPLIEVAKEQYQKKQANAAEEREDFDVSEAEFVDMYIKGVRSEVRELMLALGLLSILFAARAFAPDKDEDAEVKGAYRWALRGLDKLTDELTFMYTPSSFTSILNGSVFPAVGVLVEVEKLLRELGLKIIGYTVGDQQMIDRHKVSKHLFRLLPVTKELMSYVAIFNSDIAKEYGLRVNTYYGSAR